jgi:hypothetical protein
MRIRSCLVWAAGLLTLALPLTARAQGPGDPRAAGVELSAAAMELQAAAQQTLAGTPAGDALIRDLQALRTRVDEFRAAMDLGRSPEEVGRRFARLAGAHRLVENDLANMGPGLPGTMAHRARRYERAFADLAALMGGY